MKFSPKILSRVAALVAVAGLASCSPSAPESPANDIVVSEKSLVLTPAKKQDTTDITLVCGCPYTLSIVSYTGDTTMITYDVPIWRNFPGEIANAYGVTFKGADGAATGNYSTTMIVKGGAEGYLDTITTTYQVQ